MSTFSLIGTILLLGLLLLFGGCPPPIPPRITEFRVAPANTCARVPVAVFWTYDGEGARLTSSPHTTTPDGDLPGTHINGSWLFETASTDTTFALTARREGLTVSSTPVTAHILPNPFSMDMELTYNCSNERWEHPELSTNDYAVQITVRSLTNLTSQPLVLDWAGQSTVLPPGVATAVLSPRQLPGGGIWQAHLRDSTGPLCIGIPIRNGQTSVPIPDLQGTAVPNPISVRIISSCSIQ